MANLIPAIANDNKGMIQRYKPTSPQEFPLWRGAGRRDMPPGSYLASDVLSCRDLAGRNKYARHRVSKVLTADGVIEITLDSPLQRWSSRWSSVTLTGECTYLTDSVNGNYNITVHDVCQLVIKATAIPRPFREDKKETQLLDGLQLHRCGFVAPRRLMRTILLARLRQAKPEDSHFQLIASLPWFILKTVYRQLVLDYHHGLVYGSSQPQSDGDTEEGKDRSVSPKSGRSSSISAADTEPVSPRSTEDE